MIAASRASGAAAGKWILLVDDDEVFRDTTASILRSAGYRVQSAPDYRLALEILERGDPVDLLVLDIVMPDRVNGFALARMARLRRPDLKVIYISGFDIPPAAGEEALGPIIRKPLDNDQLLDEIARILAV
ncbi:MAG: response regulator [Stellaceae bacterium]